MKRGKVSTKVVKQEEVKAPTISSRTIVGNTTACPPLVIESKKIILLAYGAIIKSVCIQTGNLLTTYTGHQDIVTHIAKYEASGNELLITSTSIDGVVNVWNQTTLETVTSSNVGIPILKVLLLPRIKENNEVVEEKDSTVIKPTAAVNDAYFLTHPEKNNKDPLNQTFTVQIHNSTDFQTLEASPTITTTSTIFESFRFSLKSEISLDYSSSTMETAIITVENKYLVFHILSKHLFAQKTKKIDIGLEITALACHPATGVIAVGTQYGEIFLFRNVSDYLRAWYQSPNKKDKEFDGILIKSKLTWHSHAVKSLAFSVDGRILYSGGEESVLTIWNLNKSLKSFIPRVGAPISSIVSFQDASQATKILLSSADNGLKLINTVNVEVEWSWQALFVAQTLPQKLSSSSGSEDSLKQRSRQILLQHYLYPYASFDQQSDKHWKPVLEVDPSQARHITVAGNLGALQWLDTNAAVVSKKLNVLNYIRVSRKDSPKNHFIPTVIHHKFTQDGRILVTVDMKKNEEILTEYSLKFWLLEDETEGENSNGHELIAQMNSPHQDLPITALAVASLGHVSNFSLIAVAATASLDGLVKVWKGAYETIKAMTKAKEANGNTPLIDVKTNKFIWNCAYSFQYRSSPCLALAWSSDLSLLSVAHDNIVSFWNPHTVTMKHAITDDLRIKIRYLAVIEPRSLPQFGRGCGQAFLLVGSVSVIRVYDLMTMTLLWSYSARYINAVAVAKDEREIWKSEEKSGDEDSSIFKKEGWIALSVSSNKLHTEDNEDILAPKQKSEKDEESSTKRKSPVNEVLIFSPISSTPLVQYTTPSKIASLSFLANPDSQSTDLIALTLDSEVIAISSSTTTSSESTKQIQVARVKQAKLPVIIQETKLEDDGVVIISAEEKKKQLNHKLLVPAANSRLTNKNWLKELIPENNQDLPKPSDITLDFLKAISSQRDPSTSTSAPSSSIISSSTLTNSSSSAHLIESQKDALHSSSAAKKSSVKRKIDIDQITSILEKKIPLLAKRSFSQLNDDEEENHTEDNGHDSNGVAQAEVETNGKSKSKAKSSSKKVASDEPTFASPPPKEQLPPTTPAAPIVPPTPETENRRKTRRMTRSESDLSEANVPQALLANVEQNLPPVTPSKSKASSSAIVATPSKTVTTAPSSATKESSKKAEVVVESETRVTRSRQRKNSESESESEVEKELPAEPRTARASRRRPETLATIPEEKVVAEDVKEETEEVADETKGPRRSTRKRGKSDLEETENEEKDEKQDTKSKRRNTKK